MTQSINLDFFNHSDHVHNYCGLLQYGGATTFAIAAFAKSQFGEIPLVDKIADITIVASAGLMTTGFLIQPAISKMEEAHLDLVEKLANAQQSRFSDDETSSDKSSVTPRAFEELSKKN